MSTGILFSHNDKRMGSFFDFGCSAYNINRPKQSLLADDQQRIPMRFSVQSSYQKYLNDNLLINIKSIYQLQANVHYLLGGFSIAKLFKEESEDCIGMGVWARSTGAIAPYVFFEFNNFQTGISYDILTNDIKKTSRPLNSLELSLQIKFSN